MININHYEETEDRFERILLEIKDADTRIHHELSVNELKRLEQEVHSAMLECGVISREEYFEKRGRPLPPEDDESEN